MYLFFDTETTGVPKNYNAPATDLNNWPRVIQLAYQLYNEKEELVTEFCKLIKPDGWQIPKEKFWIDNGYNTEKSLLEGIEMEPVLQEFISLRKSANYNIAHNISFDNNVLGAEMIRYNMSTLFEAKQVCTMQLSTNICKIPGNYGFKWPKLTELHQHLFNADFESAHDALADVKATARCFFEMKNKGLITL